MRFSSGLESRIQVRFLDDALRYAKFFNEPQPVYGYKRYAYMKKRVYVILWSMNL